MAFVKFCFGIVMILRKKDWYEYRDNGHRRQSGRHVHRTKVNIHPLGVRPVHRRTPDVLRPEAYTTCLVLNPEMWSGDSLIST